MDPLTEKLAEALRKAELDCRGYDALHEWVEEAAKTLAEYDKAKAEEPTAPKCMNCSSFYIHGDIQCANPHGRECFANKTRPLYHPKKGSKDGL